MTVIQKALLSHIYPEMDMNLLQEIIDATPNPELATEIMCGLYLEPELPIFVYNDDKTRTYVMEKFDKWTDKITYSYMAPRLIHAYYPHKVNKAEINESNYQSLRCDSNDGETYSHQFMSETLHKSSNNTIDYKRWMALHEKCPIDTLAKVLEEAASVKAHVIGEVNSVQ